MAGGKSERMRSTLGPSHKALVPVLGVPLLEHNLCRLLSSSINDIVVAIRADEPELEDYVRTRGHSLASSVGASLECFVERQPLGTIGAAGAFSDRADALLIVNVDNLTAIDLNALRHQHRQSNAALTIAVHWEDFLIPFGEVSVSDGRILQYLEKPTRRIRISSGVYVLSPKACNLLSQHRRTDVPELFEALVRCGESVAAFEHAAPWIDVNDATAVGKAERLLLEHAEAFDYRTGFSLGNAFEG
jgi:mannose-1-phosphate guanylyltransferase/phosphomannomutase